MLILLGKGIAARIPGQGGEQLVPEDGQGIVLTGADHQGIVVLGRVLAVEGVLEHVLAVAAPEIDLEALFGVCQAHVTEHFDAAVDGKAGIALVKGQIAENFVFGPEIGVDTGAAEHLIGIHGDAGYGQGVVFVDDIGGSDHIAGQLIRFEGRKAHHGGGGEADGVGVELGFCGGQAAVQGVADLAGAGEDHIYGFYIVVDTVGGLQHGGGGNEGNPGAVFGTRGWLGEVIGTIFAADPADTSLVGHIIDVDIVGEAAAEFGNVYPALLAAQGEGGIDGVAAQLRLAGADDHDPLAGFQDPVGQTEHLGVGRIIAEGKILQIQGLLGGVDQLHPVVALAVGLHQVGCVGGHHLADQQRAGGCGAGCHIGGTALVGIGVTGGGLSGDGVGTVLVQGIGAVVLQSGDLQRGQHIAGGAGEQQGAAALLHGETGLAGGGTGAAAQDQHRFTGLKHQILQPVEAALVGIVAEVAAGEIRGSGTGILQLHPVAQVACGIGNGAEVGGHDLVDHDVQIRGVHKGQPLTEALVIIAEAGGSFPADCPAAVGLEGPGGILRHLGHISLADGVAHGAGEHNGAAGAGQGKGGFAFGGTVTGAADHGPLTGLQHQLGDLPLEGIGRVIAEIAAGQIHVGLSGIVQLDPVAEGALRIQGGTGVGGHDLADNNLNAVQRAHGLQPFLIALGGVFKAGCGLGAGGPETCVIPHQGHILIQPGHIHTVHHHIGAVVQEDGVGTLGGNTEGCILAGITGLVAPDGNVAIGGQDGALGEDVADGVQRVGEHIAGDIGGSCGEVAQLNVV